MTSSPTRASTLESRFLAVQAIALEAGALALRYFKDRGALTVSFKGPQDYLTQADGAVESLIAERLKSAFPDDGFLGEEGTRVDADRMWVVDPIDGTANFAHGIPVFSTSIALVQGGEIECGTIYDPVREELFTALRGAGAWLNGARLQVSATTRLDRSIIEVGWSARQPAAGHLKLLQTLLAQGCDCRRGFSGALGLAYVAAGRVDGNVELHINSWDVLAGILMVREAGGLTNDFLKGEALLRGNPILAAPPALAKELATLCEIPL